MNISGTNNLLVQAVKDLAAEWQQTKAYWRDAKADDFEKKYLEPIPQHVARAVTAIEEITALLRKVRHDCE